MLSQAQFYSLLMSEVSIHKRNILVGRNFMLYICRKKFASKKYFKDA